jgi:hypothetical protein
MSPSQAKSQILTDRVTHLNSPPLPLYRTLHYLLHSLLLVLDLNLDHIQLLNRFSEYSDSVGVCVRHVDESLHDHGGD